MKRRDFVKNAAITLGGVALSRPGLSFPFETFPVVRTRKSERRFESKAIEQAIVRFQRDVKDRELSWLFENCFPNTLDTTVTFRLKDNRPDTYVITGDIDAMWLRDSSAQVWPYLNFIKNDIDLRQLIAGVINRQTACILKDPYANAFYDDPARVGEWAHDLTDMKPGIHERKWEIDSLCYPIRLAYQYWKLTGDVAPFDEKWKNAVRTILKTFREQQRKSGDGPYHFERNTSWATDSAPLGGYGYPVNPIGLICSTFRPSDDATIYLFLIPSNFFAMVSLRQAAEMVNKIFKDAALAEDLSKLAAEVEQALKKYGIINHPDYGRIYPYEVNGFGSFNLMDDANVPSLLGLPYIGAVDLRDEVYQNTRKMLLSANNPFFYKGRAGEGIGGPHAGKNMIWTLGIIMRGLTSGNGQETRQCLSMLKATHAGTGFMHESFHKDDAKVFTRKWFAWANTLFGELLWKTYTTAPKLLS